METLSIVAYFQPITKPEIDEIRGVSTHPGIFELLLNNEWIENKGKKGSSWKASFVAKTTGIFFNILI